MPKIEFYNTLTHAREVFESIVPGQVTMYNCGPTVYDYAHIGNFRAFVFADVLRRFLELSGYRVQQVMNITDVGHMTDDQLADGGGQDKMAVAAQRLKDAKKSGRLDAGQVQNPDDPRQVAEFYTRAFLDDAARLNLKIATDPDRQRPRATQYVTQMQGMIRRLIERGHAYVGGDGAVYYSVESFPDYGRLSGNTLDKLRGGAGGRVLDQHQAAKRHPADFLLWKPDPSHIMKWDSPWGPGYPGWHIECSAMATTVLGRQVIDIHTGGEDNIFPHHECEIAQTCGATGEKSFARFWMHTRFLLVEGQKMSKSKGNFFTVKSILDGEVTGRKVDPAVLRMELFKSHYRSNANFTVSSLVNDSAARVQRLREFRGRLAAKLPQDHAMPQVNDHPVLQGFIAALSDDLNMSAALAEVDRWVSECKDEPSVALAVLEKIDSVLGVIKGPEQQVKAGVATVLITATGPSSFLSGPGAVLDPADLCRQLDAARARKDFAAADALRKQLQDAGYDVRTTKDGTQAVKRLA
jgi:cysteinyl-tRNA synthetase